VLQIEEGRPQKQDPSTVRRPEAIVKYGQVFELLFIIFLPQMRGTRRVPSELLIRIKFKWRKTDMLHTAWFY
jgi:hypothetical protein